ncbi:MAG: 50S ribosomal protein L3 [Phycisphaerales bacterium]|nr:50S ribosomal protein L3 [Phycisphaerales bacterium]
MSLSLLGTKLGMTRVYNDDGVSVPVTVIALGPCVVTQVKTQDVDGYDAVQIGYGELKPRNSTMPIIGHDAKANTAPKRHHREFKPAESKMELPAFELGQTLDVSMFEKCAFVDVIGTSKGKGYQGGMKRHNFGGQPATHGTERKHRSPGSIAAHATNRGTGPKPKKGKRMAGHMGDERVTVRSLSVVKIDKEQGLILVKGPVPGADMGLVEVREGRRLYKSKGVKQKEALGA